MANVDVTLTEFLDALDEVAKQCRAGEASSTIKATVKFDNKIPQVDPGSVRIDVSYKA